MVLARKSRVMNFVIYELSSSVGVADHHQVQLLCISLQGVCYATDDSKCSLQCKGIDA